MRPARDEPRLPWHPLQPARRHHNPPPSLFILILFDNIHVEVYQSQGVAKNFC